MATATAVIVAMVLFLWCNVVLSRPWTIGRILVLAGLTAASIVVFAVPTLSDGFALAPDGRSLLVAAAVAATAGLVLWVITARSHG